MRCQLDSFLTSAIRNVDLGLVAQPPVARSPRAPTPFDPRTERLGLPERGVDVRMPSRRRLPFSKRGSIWQGCSVDVDRVDSGRKRRDHEDRGFSTIHTYLCDLLFISTIM